MSRRKEIEDYLSYEQKINSDIFQNALDAARIYDTEMKPKSERNTNAEFSVTQLVEKISSLLEKKINVAEDLLRQKVSTSEYSKLLESFELIQLWNQLVRIFNKPEFSSSRNQFSSEIMLLQPFLEAINVAIYNLIILELNIGGSMADWENRGKYWAERLPRLVTSKSIYEEIINQVNSRFYKPLNQKDLESAYDSTIRNFDARDVLEKSLKSVEVVKGNISRELRSQIENMYPKEVIEEVMSSRIRDIGEPQYSQKEEEELSRQSAVSVEEEEEEELQFARPPPESQGGPPESQGGPSGSPSTPVIIEPAPPKKDIKKGGRPTKAQVAERKKAEDLNKIRDDISKLNNNLILAERDLKEAIKFNDKENIDLIKKEIETIIENIELLKFEEEKITGIKGSGKMNISDIPTPFIHNMFGNKLFYDDIF